MHKHNRNTEPQSSKVVLLIGIFAACFGLFWTIMAATMFLPMALFGILWTAVSVTTTISSYKNAKKREEQQNQFKQQEQKPEYTENPKEIRCPYCGAPIRSGDKKCEYCDSEF